MKQFFIAILLVAIISCKKEKDTAPSVPLVKSWQHNTPNIGQTAYTYEYDKQGKAKLTRIISSVLEFTYFDDKVLLNYYNYFDLLTYRETIDLDNNGYIIQKHNSQTNQFTYYSVTADGYVKREIQQNGGATVEDRYHYNTAGLLDTVQSFSNSIPGTSTIYKEYDISHEYTIGNDNIGRSFMGRKFKHPPLKYTRIFPQIGITVNFTHNYTYDAQGRITKDERIATNGDNYTDFYEYW